MRPCTSREAARFRNWSAVGASWWLLFVAAVCAGEAAGGLIPRSWPVFAVPRTVAVTSSGIGVAAVLAALIRARFLRRTEAYAVRTSLAAAARALPAGEAWVNADSRTGYQLYVQTALGLHALLIAEFDVEDLAVGQKVPTRAWKLLIWDYRVRRESGAIRAPGGPDDGREQKNGSVLTRLRVTRRAARAGVLRPDLDEVRALTRRLTEAEEVDDLIDSWRGQ